jgi:1-acyl-sn-glycerol-3-phosphate acyltransferase
MTGSALLGLWRSIAYSVLTLAAMPVQAALLLLHLPGSRRLPLVYHRWTCALFGFQIIVRGTPSTARPTLFVANHSSYFDIIVLGSLIETSFIAKSEMITWPLFGWLARLQRSVFVDRRPINAGAHAGEVARRLAAGDDLVLFAEGTTSDGNRLLPFKSALFAVAEQAPPERPLTIQPVSIIATALDRMPLGRALRPLYAWYGDMPMLSHVWQALTLGRITVTVEFHPTFAAAGLSRKALAAQCQAEVAQGVARAITGRHEGTAEAERHDDPQYAEPGYEEPGYEGTGYEGNGGIDAAA